MVSTHYYEDPHEDQRRRYSSRSHAYAPLGHDRDISPSQIHGSYSGRSQRLSPQESRDHADDISNTRPRSRIPVACGRCRKRKIKCSGVNGNGGACHNCKTAGNQDCQFNRVQSMEYALKSDVLSPTDEYSGAGARLNCRNIPSGPQAYGYHNQLPIDNYTAAYRNNSIQTQYSQYPVRQTYSSNYIHQYAPQDVLDYSTDGATYGLLPVDNYSIQPISNYTTSNERGWSPAPLSAPNHQLSKNSLYLEQSDAVYNHSAPLYPSHQYRMSMSSEQKLPEPQATMAPQLPAPLSTALPTTDRVLPALPYPAANRPGNIATFLRSNEGLSYNSYQGLGYSTNHDYSYNRGVKLSQGSANSDSSVSDASVPVLTAYLPPSNTSTESLSSQQMPYNSQPNMLEHQNGDNYTSRNSQHSHTYEPELPTTSYRQYSISRSQPDLQVNEPPSSQPIEEQRQQLVSTTDNERLLSNGRLSNGQQYVPPMSLAYPVPPVYIHSDHTSPQSSPVNNNHIHTASHHSPIYQKPERRFSSPRTSIAAT